MNRLTAPHESKILGPDGKPIVIQVPVELDPDSPRHLYYHVTGFPYVKIDYADYEDEDDDY